MDVTNMEPRMECGEDFGSARLLEDVLPVENWMTILELCLYTRGEFHSRLQWEDRAGVVGEMEEEQEVFKESFYLVSRASYRMARQVLAKYLVITTQGDVDEISDQLRDDGEGIWTERIDLRVRDPCGPTSVEEILRATPNLRVFVIQTQRDVWCHRTRYPPDNIVKALGVYCPNLVRLQFESWEEEPSMRLVKELLGTLPCLKTLHVDSMYCQAEGDDDNSDTITVAHPALETLSIGNLRRWYPNAEGIQKCGDLLRSCIKNHGFPLLNTVYLQKPIPTMTEFLEEYGDQVRELGYGAGDLSFAAGMDWSAGPENRHPHISSHCPNLTQLVLITYDRPLPAAVRPLHSLQAVQRISVVQIPPPQRTYARGAALQAFHEIEEAGFPSLQTIEVAISTYREAVEGVEGWYNTVEATEERGVEVKLFIL